MNTVEFLRLMNKYKFGPYMGVPCSFLKYLLAEIENCDLEHYECPEEGSAMGLAAGFSLSGKTPVVYMQTDGLANALNPLSSLSQLYDLPALLVISWRGQPQISDAPQHATMGANCGTILGGLEIPFFFTKNCDAESILKKARKVIDKTQKCAALIIEKDFFEPISYVGGEQDEFDRLDYLENLNNVLMNNDLIVGTTGYTSREMMWAIKKGHKFPVVGSMGCASVIGLGLALQNPSKRVVVLDGDGAVLMKPQNLAMISAEKPRNFIHICFDNESYASTGQQPTLTHYVDLEEVAKGFDYTFTTTVFRPEELNDIVNDLHTGSHLMPAFINVKVSSYIDDEIPRPKGTPVEWKKKFIEGLR